MLGTIAEVVGNLVRLGFETYSAREEDQAAAAERFHEALVASAASVRAMLDSRAEARAKADAAIEAAAPVDGAPV
jgi:hypothetical protein